MHNANILYIYIRFNVAKEFLLTECHKFFRVFTGPIVLQTMKYR